ncbi:ABC transporter permease subunit [Permianibacter aggregans]|uniref:Putrescine transport system permease protein n=1 Tax=Permianibacter aggregans TaxID=1510150 RepID=A0A4R6V4R8_9GAMM|nr:ABC transporter permease subunit [Permianibacter aggregans]QGX41366.1 ABC transporter permease subunit [Permianibacter aggregans]TDQ51154.1 putrescine transport system permease protein [Permianibacter aggregans]
MSLAATLKKWSPNPRAGIVLVPALWMTFFFLAPFAIVLVISFMKSAIAMPPVAFEYTADGSISLLTTSYARLFDFDDLLYINAYLGSLKMAGVATLCALLIGYPMAYAIARAPGAWRHVLLMMVILPSWTSFLIRIYAWIGLLKNNGFINNFLIWLGVIDTPIQMMQTDFAIYVGIVYAYLPFMILPLYTNLVKHDHTLLEAANDLGANRWTAFWRITVPLSFNGIVAGSMLVFIPAVGEFVIPEILGGPDQLMIGKVLWQEFFNNRDWPSASAVAIVMLAVLMIPIAILQKYQNKASEENA